MNDVEKVVKASRLLDVVIGEYITKNCNELSEEEKFFMRLNALAMSLSYLLPVGIVNNEYRLKALDIFCENIDIFCENISDYFFKEGEKKDFLHNEVIMNEEKFKHEEKIKELAQLINEFIAEYMKEDCNDLSGKEKFFIHLNSLGVNVSFLLLNCLGDNSHRMVVLDGFCESVKLNLVDDCFVTVDKQSL